MKNNIKYDDSSWHEDDAGSRIQAGMHIALVYFWLLLEGFMIDQKALESARARKESPGSLFELWSDGKLTSRGISGEAIVFLNRYYDKKYFHIIGEERIPQIEFNSKYESPYNIKDNWRNIDKARKFLNKEFSNYKEKKS